MPTDFSEVDSAVRERLGELYFLATHCGSYSIMKYRANRCILDNTDVIERDFGWFPSPYEALRAAVAVEKPCQF
jgi:hypothetical protein